MVTPWFVALLCLESLIAGGCKQSVLSAPDAAPPDMTAPPADLSTPDLSIPDLSTVDLSATADLVAPADLATPPDLTALVDLTPVADLAACGSCMPSFICCNNACVNPANDIHNCGGCGTLCGGMHPYCDNGVCSTPPCSGMTCAAPEFCCGNQCCAAGQLCCSVPGPIVMLLPQCTTPTADGNCPAGCTVCRCNPEGTPIAGPAGNRPIETLVEGDLVYSIHRGRLVTVTIKRTQRVPVHDHVMVRVVLAGAGAMLESARHPTADGRTFGELRAGDEVDGLRVLATGATPYGGSATYDILPDSDSGAYFANGVLVGSTLAPGAARVTSATAPQCLVRAMGCGR
jgi:hypothetical protein